MTALLMPSFDQLVQFGSTALRELRTGLFIDGSWRQSQTGQTFTVLDPATETVLADVADGSEADARLAMDAAAKAQPGWAATPPRERGEILRRAFEAVIAQAEDLALLLSLEMGKPLAESLGEVRYAAEFLRWFSEEAVRMDGRYALAPDGGSRILTQQHPVGPCVFVTPWNFPLAMGTRKIGPALAAGCTVVIKPAQQTPLSMLKLAHILDRCGVPPGVVNVVPTTTSRLVVKAMLEHVAARKISFTGSTEVGKLLAAEAGRLMLRASFELGGNAPFIVCADADIEAAVEGAMLAKMRNMGEACTAANRFLVHRSLLKPFEAALAAKMAAQSLGHGLAPGALVGPLIDGSAREGVAALVEDAVRQGAQVITGGAPVGDQGYFYAPTVLSGVEPTARILTQEIFGPVAPIVVFDSDEEAISIANNTTLGLASYLYTRDIGHALRLSEQLEFGMVGLNRGLVSNPAAPFGGIKESGIGREGGYEGIFEYLNTKHISMSLI